MERKNIDQEKLEKLAEDINDISDPASFDKVQIYLEDLQSESEEYIGLLVEKLEYREITWEQPWYQASTSLTKYCKPFYDRNQGEQDTDKFRTDKITQEENERILKNWNRFTKKYNVPDKLESFVRWRNYKTRKVENSPEERTRRFVVAYMSRGLERTLQQVFTYVKYFHLKETDTKYTEIEQKIIETCLMHKPDKAPSMLSIVLGRHPRGLYKRKKNLDTGIPEKKKLKWTMDSAGMLVKHILHYTELTLDELKNAKIEKSIWLQIQEEMNRNHWDLFLFWDRCLHVQLFVKCDLKLYKLRRKLFKILRGCSYKVWKDIKWLELLQYFPDGVTCRFLYKMSSYIVQKHPNYLKAPLEELADFGLQIIKAPRYKRNKRLKTLQFNSEGNLEVIRYTSGE